jgi:hypothetical protein
MTNPSALIAYFHVAARAHGNSFHVDLGDLPTWLGVAAAAVAAFFVYRQLAAQSAQLKVLQEQLELQRAETARQTAAVERQQANDVEVRRASRAQATGNARWRAVIHNGSSRPIRDVAARIECEPGAEPQRPFEFMLGEDRPYRNGANIRVLHKGEQGSLGFQVPRHDHPDAEITVRFDDDAGLHWEIDHNMHLMRRDLRDW